jgi:hypothetical protein
LTTWFATSKREKYCLANILPPNQLCAKSFELAYVLAWQKLTYNQAGSSLGRLNKKNLKEAHQQRNKIPR